MTKDWEANRNTITRYYKEERMPLNKVMEIMANEHKFQASTRTYRTHLKDWGLFKYNTRRPRGSADVMNVFPPQSSPSHTSFSHSDSQSPPSTPHDFGIPYQGLAGSSDMGEIERFNYPKHHQYQNHYSQSLLRQDEHHNATPGSHRLQIPSLDGVTHSYHGRHYQHECHSAPSTPGSSPRGLNLDNSKLLLDLYHAICQDDEHRVSDILSHSPGAVDYPLGGNYASPLHLAVSPRAHARSDGIKSMVSRLLSCGANANVQDDDGNTPLHVLIKGHVDAAPESPLSLAPTFPPAVGGESGSSWWHDLDKVAAAQHLLCKSNVNLANFHGETILHIVLSQLYIPAPGAVTVFFTQILQMQPDVNQSIPTLAFTHLPSPTPSSPLTMSSGTACETRISPTPLGSCNVRSPLEQLMTKFFVDGSYSNSWRHDHLRPWSQPWDQAETFFLDSTMRFVQLGANLDGLLSNEFDRKLAHLAEFNFNNEAILQDLQKCIGGGLPRWVAIWLSACRQNSWNDIDTHLKALERFSPSPGFTPALHEQALHKFLDNWAERLRAECAPSPQESPVVGFWGVHYHPSTPTDLEKTRTLAREYVMLLNQYRGKADPRHHDFLTELPTCFEGIGDLGPPTAGAGAGSGVNELDQGDRSSDRHNSYYSTTHQSDFNGQQQPYHHRIDDYHSGYGYHHQQNHDQRHLMQSHRGPLASYNDSSSSNHGFHQAPFLPPILPPPSRSKHFAKP